MQTILLPYDGSRGANSALAYVLARTEVQEDIEVRLINIQPPAIAGKLAQILTIDMMTEMRLAAGQKVLQPARDLLKAQGISCAARVVLGKPAESIVRYAAEQGCAMIVMGTRGMGAIGNLVLGSIATKVVSLATVPVTLVKAPAEMPALLVH